MNIKHFVTMENLELDTLMYLINRAIKLKNGSKSLLNKQYTIANIFFENSTRTSVSFQRAEQKLNLDHIDLNPSISSLQKGESLYDTLLTLKSLEIDAAVIRHNQEFYYEELIENNSISIINAGDGTNQHPTQCLLDLMTIYEEYDSFKGLKIGIVGDLKHSRVAKSNIMLLKKLGSEIYFSGPFFWFDKSFEEYGSYEELDELIPKLDVLMLLRVQHERHIDGEVFSKEEYHNAYGLTHQREKKMKSKAIIMHPGPINRGVELDGELVESPKSRFVKQMHNGLYARMALLETILKDK